MLSCYPVHIMLKFSRIMYAAMLSVTSNANGAIATGTVIVATRYFQESSNRIWLRIRESNSTSQWLTATPMHLARVLRNRF